MIPSPEQVMRWLDAVPDPEIPVLSITELGIVRDVQVGDDVTVSLAPTYSACPATEVIEQSVIEALQAQGIANVRIRRSLSPPWSTDWISESARQKLREYGITPPQLGASKRSFIDEQRQISCPRCGSDNSALVSEFGSTPCKASYRCVDCLEPFEYFKCI